MEQNYTYNPNTKYSCVVKTNITNEPDFINGDAMYKSVLQQIAGTQVTASPVDETAEWWNIINFSSSVVIKVHKDIFTLMSVKASLNATPALTGYMVFYEFHVDDSYFGDSDSHKEHDELYMESSKTGKALYDEIHANIKKQHSLFRITGISNLGPA